jgi:hypothetical protein
MPIWLIELVNNPPAKKNIKLEGHIAEGGRNNYLASVGGKLWSQGTTRAKLLTYLLEENTLNCSPP